LPAPVAGPDQNGSVSDLTAFRALVTDGLAAQQTEVTARVADLLGRDDLRRAEVIEFEYLAGLDHAIVLHAFAADGSSVNREAEDVFEGFGPQITALAEVDRQLASAARHDEVVVEAVEEWFETCWRAAGGEQHAVRCVWRLEGGSEAWDLQAQQWVTP
jgi:hypothetical protein